MADPIEEIHPDIEDLPQPTELTVSATISQLLVYVYIPILDYMKLWIKLGCKNIATVCNILEHYISEILFCSNVAYSSYVLAT